MIGMSTGMAHTRSEEAQVERSLKAALGELLTDTPVDGDDEKLAEKKLAVVHDLLAHRSRMMLAPRERRGKV